MKVKGKIALLLVTLILVNVMLTGCGNNSAAPAPSTSTSTGKDGMTLEEYAKSIATPLSAEDEAVDYLAKSDNPDKVVWKHAVVTANLFDSPSVRGERQFLIEMKKRLGDKVQFEVFLGGVLGTSSDQIIGGIQNKNFTSASFNVGAMAEYTNAFMPFDVMYLMPDYETAFKATQGEPFELMREECIKDTGVNVLFSGAIGMRHITNDIRPIKSVADMKGLKIRVQNNPLHILAFETLGTAPTPIAFAELFTSLQQGVIDGQENPISNIFAQNYVEVQKYFTYSDHLYTAGGLLVNNEWLLEQTPEFQEAVWESAKVALDYTGPELQKTEEAMMKRITEQGFEVVTLSDEAKAELIEISKGTWDKAAEIIGVDYFNKIKASIENMK